jgi:hypothetical protein
VTAASVRDRFDFLFTDFSLGACLAERAASAADATPGDLTFCWEKLRRQGLLNDFLIRRVNFQHQHLADVVILWMVVVLTLSGVVLAGFQIVASTRLGQEAGPEPPSSELLIERDRLFLRSSITGLFILIVSFAFFFTYVLHVYKITEMGTAPSARSPSTAAAAVAPGPPPPNLPRLGGGGLGAAPE